MLCRTHQPQWGSPEPRHSLQVEYWPQASTGTLDSCKGAHKNIKESLHDIKNEIHMQIWLFFFYQHRFSWECLTAIFSRLLYRRKVAARGKWCPLSWNMTLPLQTGIDWHWLAWVLTDQLQETKTKVDLGPLPPPVTTATGQDNNRCCWHFWLMSLHWWMTAVTLLPLKNGSWETEDIIGVGPIKARAESDKWAMNVCARV